MFKKVREKPYSDLLSSFLDREYGNYVIYPPRELMFNAFKLTSPREVKCVIIGQDPYHNEGEAMGLSFSVPFGIQVPPSLANIFKEIGNDIGAVEEPRNGDLTLWARQGVLLLNAYLSVRAGMPLSHKIPEYDAFMRDVLGYLDTLDQPIVFLLWGGFARKYKDFVTNPNHLVLEAAHPSPLAANRGGWFGNRHFSEANDFLVAKGVAPIDWQRRQLNNL